MRYYNLQFLGNGLNYILDENTPFGLDVVFRIQSTQSVTSALPSTFEILNGDISLFSNTSHLVGQQVIFNAGIKQAPYLKNQSIIATQSYSPLFFAQVDAAFGSWEVTENRCVLAFSSCRPMMQNSTFVLNKGDIIATKAQEYLQNNLLKNEYKASVLISQNALNTIFNNDTSTVFQFAKDERLQGDLIQKLAIFLHQFKLDIDYQANINVYTIYSTDSVKNNIDSAAISTVVVNPTNLLSQPVWEDASKVTLEMALDPRITLGSRIFIPTTLELFSDMGGFGNIILKSATDARILKNGYYNVLEVMHIGDSRNTDPKSWSTVCKCSFNT